MSRCMILVITLLIFRPSTANGQSVEDRFGIFEIEKSKLSEGFSVLIERVSLVDEIETEEFDEDDDDKTPPVIKPARNVSSRRVLQRVIFGDKGKRKRLDGTKYSLIGDANLSTALVESQLVDGSKALYYLREHRLKPLKSEPEVTKIPLKGGLVPMETETRWKHPFEMATSQAPLIQSDDESPLSRISLKLFSEETLKDGRDCFWVYAATGGIFRIVFNKEEAWFPEEIDFWLRELTVEEELARKPLNELTPEILKKSFCYCKSRIEWKEVSGRWVPWNMRVSYSSRYRPVSEEHEIRFRDWKFKEDFDASLLDEANFTPQSIRQSIDFRAVSDLFEKYK
ncbi:MAG: hypothetical protein ACK5OB_17960 [Pirellula sp.]